MKKITIDDVFVAVQTLDISLLNYSDIIILKDIRPTEKEIKLISQHNDINVQPSLGPAESFLVGYCSQQNLDIKLDAFQFILDYADESVDIMAKLEALSSLMSRLMTNEPFKVVLKAILDLGNLANYHYSRDTSLPWTINQKFARGFKLDTLSKLCMSKSIDGRYNMLMYLIELIYEHEPSTLNFYKEFEELDRVFDYNVKDISRAIMSFQDKCSYIRCLNFTGDFNHTVSAHVKSADFMIQECFKKFEEFTQIWRYTLQYFGEEERDYEIPVLDPSEEELPIWSHHKSFGDEYTKKPATYIISKLHTFFYDFKKCAIEVQMRQQFSETVLNSKIEFDESKDYKEELNSNFEAFSTPRTGNKTVVRKKKK
jgi:hypothetical protein